MAAVLRAANLLVGLTLCLAPIARAQCYPVSAPLPGWVSATIPGYTFVYALVELPNGDLVIGGDFTIAAGAPTDYLAMWNGATWSALGAGPNGPVSSLAVLPNGDLVVAGIFTMCGTVATNRIARWNGTSWSALGTGVSDVRALTALPNGDVVVGGNFTAVGGVAANYIARWDGATWSALGSGINAGMSSWVECLCTLANGDVVAGGAFWSAPANIARWNGTTWSWVGFGTGYPLAVTEMANGNLVASFSSGPWQWDGTTWAPLGSGITGTAFAFTSLPNGDLIAGGFFSMPGYSYLLSLLRWDGTSWSVFGIPPSITVHELLTLANGDVIVGSRFSTSGNHGATRLARFTSTCPATASAFGQACQGSVGPMILSPTALPWMGSTCGTTCTGFTGASIAFGLAGLAALNTPLAQLHPAGTPGCSLLASADAVMLLPSPVNGTTRWQFAIPNNAAFAGVALQHQVLQLELGAQQQITGFTGSNGLLLTIGSW